MPRQKKPRRKRLPREEVERGPRFQEARIPGTEGDYSSDAPEEAERPDAHRPPKDRLKGGDRRKR